MHSGSKKIGPPPPSLSPPPLFLSLSLSLSPPPPPDLLFAENDDWFSMIPDGLEDVLNVIGTSNQLYLLSLCTVAQQ